MRQVEGRLRRRLVGSLKVTCPWRLREIEEYLTTSEIGTLEGLTDAFGDRVRSGLHRPVRVLRAVVAVLGHDYLMLQGGRIVGRRTAVTAQYEAIAREARRFAREIGPDLASISLEVARSLGLREESEVQSIRKCISTLGLGLDESPDHSGEPKKGALMRLRRDFAFEYLKQQGVPVNNQEILRAMQREHPEFSPAGGPERWKRSIMTSYLGRDRRFAWAGTGTYALVEWGHDRHITDIADAVHSVLRAVGEPVRKREIVQHVTTRYRVTPAGIDFALKHGEGRLFRQVGFQRWTVI